MRNRSILTEAKQIQLATELITLGARLQVLEVNTDLVVKDLLNYIKKSEGYLPLKECCLTRKIGS